MLRILRDTDTTNGILAFDEGLIERYKNDNWENYVVKQKRINALKKGKISDLRNYDQASYAEIKYTPGSILCNSYYPFEKQYAIKWFKRFINSNFVSKMGPKRLKTYSKNEHTPLNDFLAEYYYSQLQESIKPVDITFPKELYDNKSKLPLTNFKYNNKIKLVKNNEDLREVLNHNDSIFNSDDPNKIIITPIVMTIEGGQVLYGPISGSKRHIGKPSHDHKKGNELVIKKELLDNACLLKNLPHRLFFITLGHFAQNHVVGYAKTIDRDPESYQHRVPSMLSAFPFIRNRIIPKGYDGFNNENNDSIGFKIVETFLDPKKSKYGKPTYIDVKHMDVKARIQYYYLRRELEKKLGIPIPIIASHFGISGERQAMAAATGLWPNFDRYAETENPKQFYNSYILKYKDTVERADYWMNGVMDGKRYIGKRKLDNFERAMYKPLNFNDPNILTSGELHNPFVNYDLDKDTNSVGWFYNWSINLFDEEIIEINKSDGIIGLLLDPRQLGAFAPNYNTKYESDTKKAFEEIKKTISNNNIEDLQLHTSNLESIEYLKAEPLLRNIFYIVRLISYQKDAEDHAEKRSSIYKNLYVEDKEKLKKGAWDFISLGSDYDGLIDPIDFAPTASYIPLLHRRLVVYAYIFAQIHKKEFHLPNEENEPLISSLEDSRTKMRKIFYTNGKNFILKYF